MRTVSIPRRTRRGLDELNDEHDRREHGSRRIIRLCLPDKTRPIAGIRPAGRQRLRDRATVTES
jgi:hypothetical protein